jgi:hypothetical protein
VCGSKATARHRLGAAVDYRRPHLLVAHYQPHIELPPEVNTCRALAPCAGRWNDLRGAAWALFSARCAIDAVPSGLAHVDAYHAPADVVVAPAKERRVVAPELPLRGLWKAAQWRQPLPKRRPIPAVAQRSGDGRKPSELVTRMWMGQPRAVICTSGNPESMRLPSRRPKTMHWMEARSRGRGLG